MDKCEEWGCMGGREWVYDVTPALISPLLCCCFTTCTKHLNKTERWKDINTTGEAMWHRPTFTFIKITFRKGNIVFKCARRGILEDFSPVQVSFSLLFLGKRTKKSLFPWETVLLMIQTHIYESLLCLSRIECWLKEWEECSGNSWCNFSSEIFLFSYWVYRNYISNHTHPYFDICKGFDLVSYLFTEGFVFMGLRLSDLNSTSKVADAAVSVCWGLTTTGQGGGQISPWVL